MSQLDTFQRIRELPQKQQIVMALYLCERMVPNYEFFHQLTGFGDSKPLHGTLNACWDWVANPKKTKVNFARWQEKVDEQTPSEYGHDMLGVYPAMDACTALSTLLQGLLDDNASNFLDVAKISQASVAKFIELNEAEEVGTEQLKEHVQNHELMEYEVAIQRAMINFLEQQPAVNRALVSQLKMMLNDEGVSNLGLALDAEE